MMRLSVGIFTYSTLPRRSVVHAAARAEALHAGGADVTLYALDKDGRGLHRPLRTPVVLVPAGKAAPHGAGLVRQRTAELAGFLTHERPVHDIYQAEDCLTASGLIEARGPDLFVVRTLHHVERFEDPYRAACQERSIRRADLCLAVSRSARDDVARRFGIQPELVSNGVDMERFGTPDPEMVSSILARLGAGARPVVLSVGGVEERKNTLRILQAVEALWRTHRGPRWLIVGGASVLDHGAYRARFEHARGACRRP